MARGRKPKTGKYTGDGASAVGVDLGFRPVKVEIYNVTDGDVKAEIVDDGASGVAFKLAGATMSKISANAPKIGERGFNTGADAALIENAKEFRWVAY